MRNKLTITLVIGVLALLMLLIRENEQRVIAENRLKNVQYKAVTAINEKGNAISELETQIAEQQGKMQQFREETEEMVAAREAEMDLFKAETEQKLAAYEDAVHGRDLTIASLEARIKETLARYDDDIKKKNADIAEMGEQLRKTTERLATTLKKQQSLESETLNQRANAEGLERQIQALKAERNRLESDLKSAQAKPAVSLD